MQKLSDYVEMAAAEYWQETGKAILDAVWAAEFYQDCGLVDDYPAQSLPDFYTMVQKALSLNLDRAEKHAWLQQVKCRRY